MAEFAFFALGKLVLAEAVDRLVLSGGHEPGAGIVGDARSRPLLQRRDERVLRKLLGRADIAHHSHQAADKLRLLDPEDRLDGAMGVGSRHRLPTNATLSDAASGSDLRGVHL